MGENMDASLRAVLSESERLLIAETDRAALTALDEDAAIELETRSSATGPDPVSWCPASGVRGLR